MFKSFIISLGLIFSMSTMAKTLLDCKDQSSSDGYFPARVQLIENNSKLEVKFINSKMVSVISGEKSSVGQVIKSEEVGSTTSYILEQNNDGITATALVADLKTKQATMLFFTDINKSMVQFLKCN